MTASDRSLIDRFHTAFGETKTLNDWFDDPRLPISKSALYQRVKGGWNFNLAITLPALRIAKDMKLVAFGEEKTLAEWARDGRCRGSTATILGNLGRGLVGEQAVSTSKQSRRPKSVFSKTRRATLEVLELWVEEKNMREDAEDRLRGLVDALHEWGSTISVENQEALRTLMLGHEAPFRALQHIAALRKGLREAQDHRYDQIAALLEAEL